MIIRLEFGPDESYEARAAIAGVQALAALSALDGRLRNAIKYEDHGPEARAAFETARAWLTEEREGLPDE